MAGEPLHEFDPYKLTGVKRPRDRDSLNAALEEAATYVKEQILSNCGDGKTSVQGGLWKRKLSPEYAARKGEESSANFANMELTGEMLDALETSVENGKIRIEVVGDQAPKAEGNLLGSYGRSPDPDHAREFMPHKRGQRLTKDILEGVAEILERHADDGE